MNARLLTIGVLCALLAGCSGGGSMASLQQFVATADAGYHPPVKPVPKIVAPRVVAFDMHHLIDPFEPFSMRLSRAVLIRNLHIPKGPLQNYPLDALRAVGTLSAGHKLWALITTPGGATHRAQVGTGVGEHYGTVTRITRKDLYRRNCCGSNRLGQTASDSRN